VFDPAVSSSYRNVTCGDQRCGLVASPEAPRVCRRPAGGLLPVLLLVRGPVQHHRRRGPGVLHGKLHGPGRVPPRGRRGVRVRAPQPAASSTARRGCWGSAGARCRSRPSSAPCTGTPSRTAWWSTAATPIARWCSGRTTWCWRIRNSSTRRSRPRRRRRTHYIT
jgi:hypothetical protein